MSEVTSQRGRPSPMMFVSLGIGAVVAIVLISVVSYFTGGTVTKKAYGNLIFFFNFTG